MRKLDPIELQIEMIALAQATQMICDIANREILEGNGGNARQRLMELRKRADSVLAKASGTYAPEAQFAG